MENKIQGENSDILDIDLIDQSDAGLRQLDLECDSCTFDFTQKSWSADMALTVEGTKLYVAKNILALASPVFFRMFQSRFEESTKNEVELPGKSMNDVIEFLRCIYPNSLSQVSCETALKILPLVEEYQVMHVKARCEKAMLESVDELSSPPAETLCQLLKEACLYNLKDLRDRCVKLASKKSQEELEIAYRLYPLPADAQNEILVKVNANL
ncbi:BTB and MATH domain-containing protein 38-like [Mercenaria mercenaria]|uniref:BTB and MATH domain-containing protein 38-like n=1 Tax=Mercenaria mercenaria TaxID=6596 RepID=UPI00234E63DC|nr:BTB and MATH domain-containing protein 38-like [Mercenaria mercenaria]